MKKNLKFIFLALMLLTTILCAVNITVSYLSLKADVTTSLPPETAFIYIIPYSLAILLISAVWFITHFILKKK